MKLARREAKGNAMNPREAITRQVHAALEREARINLHRYPVGIHNADGVVVLDGELPDVGAKKLALELAASVRGVDGVVDRLRVRPSERRGDGAVRDSLVRMLLAEREFVNCTIRWRANGRVETARLVEAEGIGEIEIEVSDGVIVLEGHVISQSHRRFAGVLGWWTPGCRDVVNALAVQPDYGDRDEEVADVLQIVLEADPMVDPSLIRANCRDKTVILEGAVTTERQKSRAELDAWSLAGVRRVVNRLEVTD
ncbi:MAG TPA: BON domain-containing protein [Burkholderiales bacterium]|jgi:osmotically-inducible protein OsmY|nr:BON domain-containing protein [Burkholderiales bacterium]